jgi:hypothetical protein
VRRRLPSRPRQAGEPDAPATLAAWTACHGIATILVDSAELALRHDARKNPVRTADQVFEVFLAGIGAR